MPATAKNGPWSGLFIGASTDRLRGAVEALQLGRSAHGVVIQSSYEIPGSTGGMNVPTSVPTDFAAPTTGRWVVEFSGEGAPPAAVRGRGDEIDEASKLVAADTTRKWRERALNLVEEIAGECLRSNDTEEQAAGHLALAAVEALRPYVGSGIVSDERRKAWTRVLDSLVDFVPKGRAALNLAEAVRDLVEAYALNNRRRGEREEERPRPANPAPRVRLTIEANPGGVPRQGIAPVTLMAHDAKGAPLPNEKVRATAFGGRFEENRDGRWQSSGTAWAGTTDGRGCVTANVSAQDGAQDVTIEFEVDGERAELRLQVT